MKKYKLFKRVKVSIVMLLMMALILPVSALGVFADDSGSAAETSITILHTNDIHGRVAAGIGFARLAVLVEEFRDENPNILLLDAGDTTHGLPIANLFRGESIIRLMNAVGFDVMAPGNHDFNYGWQRLVELNQYADFPIITANVLDGDNENLFESYTIFELDGVTVGVFGLTTPETTFKTHPRNVEGLTFADPVEVAQEMVDYLDPQTDIIIALVHLGTDVSGVPNGSSLDVAAGVDGLDLIVDGHSHSVYLEGREVDGTLIVSAGGHMSHLGVVDLEVAGGALVSAEARLIHHSEVDVMPDAKILAMINDLDEEVRQLGAEVIGYTPVRLEGDRVPVRTSETNLGNLIADVILAAAPEADVAFTNGGGIRDTIEAGNITVGDITRVLPFGNQVTVVQVTGQTIKDALEHGTQNLPNESGAFPQVSGMTFEVNLIRPAGDRVVDIMIGGEPIDLSATYLLATNDFIAAGGDGYTMIGAAPVVNELMSMCEAVIDYIRNAKVVEPVVEGRIVVIYGLLPCCPVDCDCDGLCCDEGCDCIVICDDCEKHPCECPDLCDDCGKYPCDCPDLCDDCNKYPCDCVDVCDDCGKYPCDCPDLCDDCNKYPCDCPELCDDCNKYPCDCPELCDDCNKYPCDCPELCDDCNKYPCDCPELCDDCNKYPCDCPELCDDCNKYPCDCPELCDDCNKYPCDCPELCDDCNKYPCDCPDICDDCEKHPCDCLELPVVDRTSLAAVITKAEERVEANYTPESWAPFATALKTARDIYASPDATQAQVNGAVVGLELAMEALVRVPTVYKAALAAAITQAEARVQANYTAASWAPFAQALASARAVYADENATQVQVNAALSALQAAMNNLVRVPAGVDRSALAATIAAARTRVRENYTQTSWTPFATALQSAQTVYANANATQAQVDAANTSLRNAMDNLVALRDATPRTGDNTSLALYVILTLAGAVGLSLATNQKFKTRRK